MECWKIYTKLSLGLSYFYILVLITLLELILLKNNGDSLPLHVPKTTYFLSSIMLIKGSPQETLIPTLIASDTFSIKVFRWLLLNRLLKLWGFTVNVLAPSILSATTKKKLAEFYLKLKF
jgi:hypothetical protein